MYIAVVMFGDDPVPVWGNDDGTRMKVWQDLHTARIDTQKMPIATAKEIVILDLDAGE
ncbi:MAG: hypothetical protein M0R32_10490 [Candidatus Cloacimonetes bacterium]|jgi:hypothetical protein|nr:hypothetical protein [Candidatus Cloacimonadota bacterium]